MAGSLCGGDYVFVTELDDTEQQVARCNPGDRYEIAQLVAQLAESR